MSTQKPTLSLCMIMKNEERWIAQCLESVQGLVDEIIIVDTGSTDRSIEIAKSYGAKVYEHPWEDDFSKSRNRSLDYATSDWILVLDADEVIGRDEIPQIKALISQEPAQLIFLVQTNYIQCSETYGWIPNNLDQPESKGYYGYVESSLVRLFRKDSARFEGIIHEHAEPTDSSKNLFWSRIRIHHYGKYSSEEVLQRKNELYFKLGQRKIQLNPNSAQSFYELGAQFIQMGKLDEAKDILLQGEKIAPDLSRIQLILAHIEMRQKNISSAIKRFLKVLEVEPQNISPYIYLPGLLIDQDQYDVAEEILNRGESLAAHYPPYHINRGALKMRQGNYRKAIKSYLKAIEINPYQYQAHLSLASCYVEIKEWDLAEKHYQICINDPSTNLAALKGLGLSYFKQNKYEEALFHIEDAIKSISGNSLEKDLLHLWKAITLVNIQDTSSAKKALKEISSFNEFEELHLKSLNECLQKISSHEKKGVSHEQFRYTSL